MLAGPRLRAFDDRPGDGDQVDGLAFEPHPAGFQACEVQQQSHEPSELVGFVLDDLQRADERYRVKVLTLAESPEYQLHARAQTRDGGLELVSRHR